MSSSLEDFLEGRLSETELLLAGLTALTVVSVCGTSSLLLGTKYLAGS